MFVDRSYETMTSKERVRRTMRHEAADRVPMQYYANEGINRRLLEHFHLGEGQGDELRDILGVDFRSIHPPYRGPRLHPEVPGRHVDPQWGIRTRWIEHQSGGYWDYCDFPLATADYETVQNWPMPNPDDFDYDAALLACQKYKDYGLSVGSPGLGDTINKAGMYRGMEQVLVDLITDEPAGLLLMDRFQAITREVARRTIEKCRGYIDFVWTGEDLGTQRSPMVSRELYRKHILPRHKRFIDMAHSFDLPIMIHTCGASSWSYEDEIAAGLDGVDTLQPEAVDMNPQSLVSRFGTRLFYQGCISTAGALAYGSAADVERDVRQTLEIMMPTRGYILAPTHSIQDNSPVENVLAMYRAGHAYGRYQL